MGYRKKKKTSKKGKSGGKVMVIFMAALLLILCVALLAVSRDWTQGSSSTVPLVEMADGAGADGETEGSRKETETGNAGNTAAEAGGDTENAGSSGMGSGESSENSENEGAAGTGTDGNPDTAGTGSTGTETGGSSSGTASSSESSSDEVEEQAREILSTMTLKEQVYQLFIVKPEQLTGVSVATQAYEVTGQALAGYPVGGIVYFAANILTREQCSTMITNSQSYSEIGLFIAVDEEGGTVARVGNNSAMGTTSFPNMKTIGDTGDTDNAYNVGCTIGTELSELGFNLDFAPVADVDSNPDNPVIGDRAFSSDADAASAMVSAAVEGFHDGGILCTLKHFPGHGDTATDSHEGYTELDKSLDELRQVEFMPFEGGISAGADFVMVGHISVPQVTGDDLPATLSAVLISILRNDLGFEGLIITDSMQMEAITDRYTSGEAAVMAIQAGVDMILMPENLQEAAQGVIDAVESGQISRERIEESVLRILETKIRAGIISE
ncbi:MAG: glycoside hydrolase family 3 protein [Lachnospiraceae bacterium]|nr:glycoside hydrolase family 3 protein [Lachnospiraceae bacterium]